MFIGDGWLPVAVSTWDGPPLVRWRWMAWMYGGWYMNFDSLVKRNRAHFLTRSIIGFSIGDSTLDTSWQMFLSKSSLVLLTHTFLTFLCLLSFQIPMLVVDCQTGTNKHHSTAITVIANSNRVSIVASFVYISLPSTISHKQFTAPRNALDPHERRQTLPSAAAAPAFFSRWWRNFSISRQQTYCLFKLSRICFSAARMGIHPPTTEAAQTFQTWVLLF